MVAMKRVAMFAAAALVMPLAAWAETGSLTPIYTVPGHVDGTSPVGLLTRVGARLFGTTLTGGSHECGTVFSIDPKSGRETIVYSFTCSADGGEPDAGLAVMGGKLFGTTTAGGPSHSGTVFEVDPKTGIETTLAAFSDTNAITRSALLGFHGLLYGTAFFGGTATVGSIFTVDPSTGTMTTIYSFSGQDGASPAGALIQANGKLYGTTENGGKNESGVIYRLEPKTGVVTTLYSFKGGSDGQAPDAQLTELGGILYGTAGLGGGSSNSGVIFSFDPASRTEHVLYSFTAGADGAEPLFGLASANGLLYGLTQNHGQGGYGTLFSIDPVSGAETTLRAFTGQDGDKPNGGLVLDGPVLYSVSANAVYSFDPVTAQLTTLHVFRGTTGGGVSSLIKVGGSLYGLTEGGGALGFGSIFKVDRATGEGKIVYSFAGMADGVEPIASLVEAGGVLYGTTSAGGSGGGGTVFGYDPGTHKLTTLHGFSGDTDGFDPSSGVLVLNGALYGTTEYGGTENAGTVYKVDPVSGTATLLHSFKSGDDGYNPQAGLTVANGLLYGATRFAGAHQCGTLFSVDPSTGNETTLYAFKGTVDGCQPATTLLSADDVLYGVTQGQRGGRNRATVFKFDPASGNETVLHSFKVYEGPTAPFIKVGDKLYGTTSRGGDAGLGSVISLNPATGHVDRLYSFTGGADGQLPTSALLHLDGTFYGTDNVNDPGGLVFGFTK